jgi:reductive dehalogenase
MDPAEASRVAKGWARRLGADLVGVARVDPRWAYSRRGEIFHGNWDDWGAEIPEPLPYAVVVATGMEPEAVHTAPHTPAVVESGFNYAKGAFITTILAQWFANLGYRAVAEHNRHYDLLLVPLAVDAGLGELGRQGYLIAEGFGPRVRLFAVQTDMPLEPDAPVDLGAAEFCRRCLKCAESCPSRSIPHGPPRPVNGTLRWKLDEDGCFEYWGKVGTDCCVCMAVCPFSRPDRGVHRLARGLLKRSRPARRLLPALDNLVYGRRWRPRPAGGWRAYPRGRGAAGEKNSGPAR